MFNGYSYALMIQNTLIFLILYFLILLIFVGLIRGLILFFKFDLIILWLLLGFSFVFIKHFDFGDAVSEKRIEAKNEEDQKVENMKLQNVIVIQNPLEYFFLKLLLRVPICMKICKY